MAESFSIESFNDWNKQIIEEFHAHNGKVGGQFQGGHLLLLTHTGAKSGQKRVSPLAYLAEQGRIFIIASKGGAPTNPDWYHNLIAHPQVTVEMSTEQGIEQFEASAVVLEGEERDQIFTIVTQRMPGFGDYQKNTDRKIPVIELLRHAS
jgi:deazaflavin-dependent oxidoreductase (nitroreductase family)